MKNIVHAAICLGVLGLTTGCQQRQHAGSTSDSTVVKKEAVGQTADSEKRPFTDTALYASLESVGGVLRLQDSLPLRFIVNNPTADTLKFTAYHTPFEGLISNFLTVKDSEGQEVRYQGPMAKRMMPPPADSYHAVAPRAKESVVFDLKKAYKIEKAGTYSLQYNSEAISGVKNGEAITITVTE